MSQTLNTSNGAQTNNKKGLREIKSNLPLKQRTKIRNRARITPWYNSSEFDYVGLCLSHATLLFSNEEDKDCNDQVDIGVENLENQDEKEEILTNQNKIAPLNDEQYGELVHGIERIALWRSRSENGRLPHSVDICASIAQIMLEDAIQVQDNVTDTMISHHSIIQNTANRLKLAYASVIIRGVNGIADSIQKNRATYGSSVSYLCSQIGLPSWIVDLRHDSAHNELPNLIPLRLAAKTLLGFLMEKYWTVLEDLRIGWIKEGERLLVECKSQCKALDRMQMEKEQNFAEDNGADDGDGEEKEEEEDTNFYGSYSIFMEGSSSKQKKKKKDPPSKPKSISTNNKHHPQKVLSRTARQSLHEFIKNIPIDVGLPLVIQYLIYGGIGDAPDGRGILIPGSPSLKENMNSVRKMRERYSLILLLVASKWPGFVHMLFVNIVDLMLSLDATICPERSRNGDDTTEMNEAEVLGKKRKIFFLKHWVHYLLSNEFSCFLQWHVIVWKGSKNIRERPREKWTEDLLLHMESHAPLQVLKRIRIPLNFVCDRFEKRGSDMCKDMVSLLENILGEERVRQRPWVKELCESRSKGSLKRSIHEIVMNDNGAINRLAYTATPNENDSDSVPKDDDGQNLLGLEEMEEICSVNVDEKDCEDSKVNRVAIANEDPQVENEVEGRIAVTSRWTLCESWEPCVIGTLPGFL